MAMTPTERRQALVEMSVDDVEEMYREGDLTAKQRNKLLHNKARAVTETLLEEKGYVGAIFAKSVQNLQQGWDNLKESAMRTPAGVPTSGAEVKQEAYYLGLAMWAQIQMLTSVFNAVGEITGAVAEREALKWGASPGLARAINIATDIGTGFVPVGMAAKSAVVGVREWQQFFKAGRLAKEAKAKEKAAEAVKQATGAMAEGLSKEAPEAAANLLRQAEVRRVASTAEPLAKEATAQTAGAAAKGAAAKRGAEKEMADPEGEKVIRQMEADIAAHATPSVREQFLADLAKYREEMKGITATQTHEMTARLASKLGYTIEDVKALFPGRAINEAEMYAYLKAVEPQVDRLMDLAKVAVSEGTEAAANALAQHASQFFTFAPKFRSAEVTAGRSVEILKETPPMKQITNLLTVFDPENMAKGNFTAAMQTFAEDLLEIGAANKASLVDLSIQGQSLWHRFRENGWPMMRTAYINLLLARPITQVRNFLGNSIAATNAVMERAAAGLFSASEKGVVNGESFYLMKGMAAAMGDAMHAFGQAFKKMSPEEASKFDVLPARIPGPLGRIIQAPGDLMRGMDNAFKTIFTRGSYYAQAMREGAQRGLQGDDLASFIAHRVHHPTEKMMAEATEFATTNTFQNELGSLGKQIQQFSQTGPMVLWFPFMKTPINLTKYAWNRTPGLQLISKTLYEDIKAGGVRADMAIGRLTMSNLQAMFLFELAKEGLITGSGPVDPALRRVWLKTHAPYSVKTKEGWVPISNIEPQNTVLGMVADYTQVMNQLDKPTAEQAAMALGYSLMHNLTDKTWWTTVSDLVDLASGIQRGYAPGTSFMQVAAGPAVAVATGGPLGQGITRGLDPVPREARGFIDTVLSKIPGYSQDYPPRRDPAYGEVALPPQAVGGSWVGLFSPLTVKDFTTDRVIKEGERLGVRVPAWPESIGGRVRDDFDIRAPEPTDRVPVELNVWQRDRWMKIYQNLLRHPEHGIETMMDTKEYQNAPQALQRELFLDMLASHRTTAREALLIEDVDLGRKVLTNNAMRYLPMLQPEDRPQARMDISEGVTMFERLAPKERDNLLRWGILPESTESMEEANPVVERPLKAAPAAQPPSPAVLPSRLPTAPTTRVPVIGR